MKSPKSAPAIYPKTSGDEDAATEETPQIRALRMAVIGMSLLLIVGFITVIARIIYLTSRPATPVAAATTAGTPIKPEALLDLPANGSVKSLSLSGNRLAVHYVSPLGDGIAILDLEQGRVISRLAVTAKP